MLLTTRVQTFNGDPWDDNEWKWRGEGEKSLKCIIRFNDDLKSVAFVQDPSWNSKQAKELKYIKASLDFSELSFATKEKLVRLVRGEGLFNLNVLVSAAKSGYRVRLVPQFLDFHNGQELLLLLERQNVPNWVKHLPIDMHYKFIFSKERSIEFQALSFEELAPLLKFYPVDYLNQFMGIFIEKIRHKFYFGDLNYCRAVETVCSALKEMHLKNLDEKHPLWLSYLNQKRYVEQDYETFILYFETSKIKVTFKDLLQIAEIFVESVREKEEEEDELAPSNKSHLFSALHHVIQMIETFESQIKEEAKVKFSELLKSEKWKEWQSTLKVTESTPAALPNTLFNKALEEEAPLIWKLQRVLKEDLKKELMEYPDVCLSVEDKETIEKFISDKNPNALTLYMKSIDSLRVPLMKYALEKLEEYEEGSENYIPIYIKGAKGVTVSEAAKKAEERYLITDYWRHIKNRKVAWIIDVAEKERWYGAPFGNSKIIYTH